MSANVNYGLFRLFEISPIFTLRREKISAKSTKFYKPAVKLFTHENTHFCCILYDASATQRSSTPFKSVTKIFEAISEFNTNAKR